MKKNVLMSARSVLFNVGILPIRCWIWVIHTVYPSTWYWVLGFVNLCFNGNYCHCFFVAILFWYSFIVQEEKERKKTILIYFSKLQNYVLIYVRAEYFFLCKKWPTLSCKNVEKVLAKEIWLYFFLSLNTLCIFIDMLIQALYYIILYYIIL